jgi:hypothetical protein
MTAKVVLAYSANVKATTAAVVGRMTNTVTHRHKNAGMFPNASVKVKINMIQQVLVF